MDVDGDQQAAARSGTRHQLLRVGQPRARSEPHARSRARVQYRPGRRARDGDDARDHGEFHVSLAELDAGENRRRELHRICDVRDRLAQHEVRIPGLLVEGRPRAAHQHAGCAVHLHRRRAQLHHRVRQPVQRERARHAGVAVRAGSVDGQAADAAGRRPMGSPVELVPGDRGTEDAVLPRRHLPAHRRRDGLQRHHSASRRRVRSLRRWQNGAQGECGQVPAGRQRK